LAGADAVLSSVTAFTKGSLRGSRVHAFAASAASGADSGDTTDAQPDNCNSRHTPAKVKTARNTISQYARNDVKWDPAPTFFNLETRTDAHK